jgi:hypothetical protein
MSNASSTVVVNCTRVCEVTSSHLPYTSTPFNTFQFQELAPVEPAQQADQFVCIIAATTNKCHNTDGTTVTPRMCRTVYLEQI